MNLPPQPKTCTGLSELARELSILLTQSEKAPLLNSLKEGLRWGPLLEGRPGWDELRAEIEREAAGAVIHPDDYGIQLLCRAIVAEASSQGKEIFEVRIQAVADFISLRKIGAKTPSQAFPVLSLVGDPLPAIQQLTLSIQQLAVVQPTNTQPKPKYLPWLVKWLEAVNRQLTTITTAGAPDAFFGALLTPLYFYDRGEAGGSFHIGVLREPHILATVVAVRKRIFDWLEKRYGFELIEPAPLEDAMDGELHQFEARVASGPTDGKIYRLKNPGYKVNGSVIKPAEVVGKALEVSAMPAIRETPQP